MVNGNGQPIDGGKLFAIPYDIERGPLEKNTRILDHMAQHTPWFAASQTPEEARANAAWMLTDTAHYKWEAWSGGRFAGVILLSRIIPRVDALFHFTLLPSSESGVTLFSARRLLWNFLGYAFDAFQLQRISAEVPEHSPKFAHFLRQRLGFRYEGETATDRLQKNRGIVRFDVPGANTWIASHGSRRESAHWDAARNKWSDLILLRLLRSEYLTRASLGELPKATSESSTRDSDVARIERRPVPATDPAGDAPGVPGEPVPTPPESPRG